MQTVVITGASGEIGRAVAKRFAQEGAKLYLFANRHVVPLQEYARTLSETHQVFVEVYGCDFSALSDPEKENPLPDLVNSIPHVDTIIHCAGAAHYALAQDTDPETFTRLMNINVTGAYELTRLLTRKMDGGHILFLSSVWGRTGAATESAYAATKGAVDAMTKSLAKELAPLRIAVNALSAGAVDSPMTCAHLSEEEITALKQEIPCGRLTSAEEVAEMLYLLSIAPVYLTGAVIPFAGAWY